MTVTCRWEVNNILGTLPVLVSGLVSVQRPVSAVEETKTTNKHPHTHAQRRLCVRSHCQMQATVETLFYTLPPQRTLNKHSDQRFDVFFSHPVPDSDGFSLSDRRQESSFSQEDYCSSKTLFSLLELLWWHKGFICRNAVFF